MAHGKMFFNGLAATCSVLPPLNGLGSEKSVSAVATFPRPAHHFADTLGPDHVRMPAATLCARDSVRSLRETDGLLVCPSPVPSHSMPSFCCASEPNRRRLRHADGRPRPSTAPPRTQPRRRPSRGCRACRASPAASSLLKLNEEYMNIYTGKRLINSEKTIMQKRKGW